MMALIIEPLFLTGDYFYLKNDENFYKEMFTNRKISEKYSLQYNDTS